MNNFPAGYFDLNANDNPGYAAARRAGLNDRPIAAIFKIGTETRELDRMLRDKAMIDANVQRELNMLERTANEQQEMRRSMGRQPRPLTEGQISRRQGNARQRRRRMQAIDRIHMVEDEADYQGVVADIGDQQHRLTRLIMGMFEGAESSRLTPALTDLEKQERTRRRNMRTMAHNMGIPPDMYE